MTEMLPVTELECPCCGDVGAIADSEGFFHDGDPLVCGCPGHVSADEDDVWIVACDEHCDKCERGEPQR